MDKQTAIMIKKILQTALDKVTIPGMSAKISVGHSKWYRDGSSIKYELEVATENDSGELLSEEEETFKRSAGLFGLEADDLGKEFMDDHQGDRYKIIGLHPRKRKYPVICQRTSDGKRFKFNHHRVKSLLADARKPTATNWGGEDWTGKL